MTDYEEITTQTLHKQIKKRHYPVLFGNNSVAFSLKGNWLFCIYRKKKKTLDFDNSLRILAVLSPEAGGNAVYSRTERE